MDLILLVLGIAVLGFIVWLVTTQIPMPQVVRTIIYVVVAIVMLLFIIRQFRGLVPDVMP